MEPIFANTLAKGLATMGAQPATATVAAHTEVMPQEPSRPSRGTMQNEIDRLVGNTLPASVRFKNDGTTEQLPTPANLSVNTNNANVAEPPSLESLIGQINVHQNRILDLRQQLGAVSYSRTTGQPDGHVVTGAAREQLEKELERRGDEMGYTVKLIESTSAARIAWNQQREAQATGGAPEVDPMSQAVEREQAIQQLAEMKLNGKPVGRVEATRQYDEAQLRRAADKLARR